MPSVWKWLMAAGSGSWLLLISILGIASLVEAQGLDRPGIWRQGPYVSPPVLPKTSRPMQQLRKALPWRPGNPVREVPIRRLGPRQPALVTPEVPALNPLVRPLIKSPLETPAPARSFEGIAFAGAYPPDPVGDVGPNHYVQMVNSFNSAQFAVYDKGGSLLYGPVEIGSLWSGRGGSCEFQGVGDPLVLYDHLADRWLLSQMADPSQICLAVSQSPDPRGAYYLYEFNTSELPDYYKIGVWPDGYYLSANESTYTAYAFNRSAMLTGSPATFQKFSGESNFLLPADLDGAVPPPPGSPNYFYTFKSGQSAFPWGGVDRLEVFAFQVDWAVPANSRFTLEASLPLTPFTYTVCGYFVTGCIPQPGTTQKIDALSEWPMWRLQYRNFIDHETLVGNFTVDADNGGGRAGIRWFELRKTNGSLWTLFQEGTHAPPDANQRFMGSIAMDSQGNIALGYSLSSSSVHPSLRYATREAADPPGLLQAEVSLVAGGGSQTVSDRWGDYSSMNVDPVLNCTFWYTGEYYFAGSTARWSTRIGAFQIPSCFPNHLYLPVIRK